MDRGGRTRWEVLLETVDSEWGVVGSGPMFLDSVTLGSGKASMRGMSSASGLAMASGGDSEVFWRFGEVAFAAIEVLGFLLTIMSKPRSKMLGHLVQYTQRLRDL